MGAIKIKWKASLTNSSMLRVKYGPCEWCELRVRASQAQSSQAKQANASNLIRADQAKQIQASKQTVWSSHSKKKTKQTK